MFAVPELTLAIILSATETGSEVVSVSSFVEV